MPHNSGEIVKKLIETGLFDSEGKRVYGCPKCGSELENGFLGSNLVVVRCPKCKIDWEVDYE